MVAPHSDYYTAFISKYPKILTEFEEQLEKDVKENDSHAFLQILTRFTYQVLPALHNHPFSHAGIYEQDVTNLKKRIIDTFFRIVEIQAEERIKFFKSELAAMKPLLQRISQKIKNDLQYNVKLGAQSCWEERPRVPGAQPQQKAKVAQAAPVAPGAAAFAAAAAAPARRAVPAPVETHVGARVEASVAHLWQNSFSVGIVELPAPMVPLAAGTVPLPALDYFAPRHQEETRSLMGKIGGFGARPPLIMPAGHMPELAMEALPEVVRSLIKNGRFTGVVEHLISAKNRRHPEFEKLKQEYIQAALDGGFPPAEELLD